MTISVGVLIRLAQRKLSRVLNRRTDMHAHTGTFSANPVYAIITSTRLELHTNVPSVPVLAQAEVLRNLSNLLLFFTWRLVSSSTSSSTTTSSRSSPATLVPATLARPFVRVHRLLWLGLNWLGVLLELLPGGRDEVYI